MSKAGDLQVACLAVLKDHDAEGSLPTSVRFIFYQLVQRQVIPKAYYDADGRKKARQPHQDVSDALMALRELEMVPWDWLVDETRALDAWRYADTVADYVRDTLPSVRIDCWQGQPPPMVLCESRSLAGVLRGLAAEYLVPIASTNGQVGGFLHTDIGPALEVGHRILYLGDWDWQGQQIEANTRKVLEGYEPSLLWERVALSEDQVDQHGLRDLVIVKKDNRYRPAREYDAVETEALGQSLIVQLLRERLDALLPEPLERVRVREAQQQDQMAAELGLG